MASRESFNGAPLAILGLASIASLLFALAVLRMVTGTVAGGHREHAAHVAPVADAASASRARMAPVTRVVACENLPDAPGKAITTVVVDFPPGAFSTRHRHSGSVSAFVVKGTIKSQVDNGPIQTFASGETWFEGPRTVHTFIENPSATDSASLLAVSVSDSGCGSLAAHD
jgi:quercetin dioxygenase-like cupin family protein